MRHPIQNAHAGTYGEYMAPRRSRLQRAIWTVGITLIGRTTKAKNKNAAKRKKHHGRAGRLACANTGGCAGISEQPEKQKQTTA
jgi:hypothetical protein